MQKIELLKQNCEKSGFEFIFVQNENEALEAFKTYIYPRASIGLGGSTTLEECGILEYILSNKELHVHNQYEEGIDMSENAKRRKHGIIADIYISSTNAITVDGELINCDGTGNRVAGQIFGSKKLIIVAGKNKIVKNIHEGFDRIKKIAAVKNAERLNLKAIKFGKKPIYTAENISHKYSIINSDIPNRTTIIIVNKELGY